MLSQENAMCPSVSKVAVFRIINSRRFHTTRTIIGLEPIEQGSDYTHGRRVIELTKLSLVTQNNFAGLESIWGGKKLLLE